MNENKSTKRALLMSVLSLLLCCSMLIGSTFAWFTDSVSSRNNVITSGNLDVTLEYSTDGTTWAPVNDDTVLFAEDDLWEPGHTVAVALRVKNVGTLAVDYALSTNIYLEKEGTNVYGETFKLSDYLEVYSCEPQGTDGVGAIMAELCLGSRNSALGNGTIMAKTAFNTDLATDDNLDKGEGHIVVVAITMPTTVGNEANHKTGTTAPYIKFGVDLYATQAMLEEDSFGSDYDKDAASDANVAYGKLPLAEVIDNGPVEDLYVESLFGGGLFDENNNEHLRDMDATFTFIAPEGETAYDEWIADYEVTVSKDLADGAAVLAGQYDFIDTDWQAFYTPAVSANQPTRLLASQGLYLTFDNVKDYVGEFQCGVENINIPEGTTLTVALKLYKQDANNVVLDEKVVGVFTYKF